MVVDSGMMSLFAGAQGTAPAIRQQERAVMVVIAAAYGPLRLVEPRFQPGTLRDGGRALQCDGTQVSISAIARPWSGES